jgi:trk system potassium uptake protein
MAESSSFRRAGTGTFGAALAIRLSKNNCRVTGMDSDPDRVEVLKDVLYEAIIGNATERDALQHLPLQKANAVFISMGEDITRSLLATLHCKELGCNRIVVKGVTDPHGKILEPPGRRAGCLPRNRNRRQTADQYTWPNVIDFLPIDPEYSFRRNRGSGQLRRKTLLQINLRRQFGVWVVGVKDVLSGQLEMFPDGEFKIGEDQMLLVVGRLKELNRLRDQK